MRVTSAGRLGAFARVHPDAREKLAGWAAVVRAAAWRNPVDARKTYAQADPVRVAGGRTVTVFNIGGNKYRLLAAIDYGLGVVNVLAVLTHAEYDQGKWKQTL